MCDPVTIGLAIVSAAYSLYTTKSNAKTAEKQISKETLIKADEIADKNSADANIRIRQARAERARLAAQAAETGVAGVSIGEILDNVDMQSGMDVAMMQNNNTNQLNSVNAEAQGRLNQVEQPDYFGTALSTASTLWSKSDAANGKSGGSGSSIAALFGA